MWGHTPSACAFPGSTFVGEAYTLPLEEAPEHGFVTRGSRAFNLGGGGLGKGSIDRHH